MDIRFVSAVCSRLPAQVPNVCKELKSIYTFFEKNVFKNLESTKASSIFSHVNWKSTTGAIVFTVFVAAVLYNWKKADSKPKDDLLPKSPAPSVSASTSTVSTLTTFVQSEDEALRLVACNWLNKNYRLYKNDQEERNALVNNPAFLQLVVNRAKLNAGDVADQIGSYLFMVLNNPVNKFSEVYANEGKRVFIGSEVQAANLGELKKKGVTLIVNVPGYSSSRSADAVSYSFFKGSSDIEYIEGNVADAEGEIPDFRGLVSQIKDHLDKNEGGNVLIHCKEGRSRSAAVVLAFLLDKHPHWSFDTAIHEFAYKRDLARRPEKIYDESKGPIKSIVSYLPREDLLQKLKEIYRPIVS